MHYDNVKIYTTEAQSAATQPAGLPGTGQAGGDPSLLLAALALALLCTGIWVRRTRVG